MSGTAYKYGRPVTQPEVDVGFVGYGTQRACIYTNAARSLIVYRLGGWVGEWEGATPYCRFFMATAAGSSPYTPGTLKAVTEEFNPPAQYTDITGGDDYEKDVTPFYHTAGTPFALGLTGRNGRIGHSMRAAAAISETNENFYDKDIASTTTEPTNPVGGTPTNQGHMSLWYVGEENVAPTAPTSLGATNSLTPTFTSFFNDANKTLNNGVAYDYATEVHIVIKQGATERWNYVYTPSAGTHSHSREYSGAFALQYETTYTYEVRHKDRHGLWSPWASTSFVITPANTKPDTPTGLSPTGSVIGIDTTPTMKSNFSDPQETLSTGQAWDYLNQYEIKVSRVSDGASMWAPAVFTASSTERENRESSRDYAGTALEFAVSYKYEIRHKDRGGLWSNWASTTFTLTSLATVDAPTNPSGYETSATDPGDVTFKYDHASSISSNAFEVRLLSSSGSVLKTSPVIAKTVAAGGTATITWAETTFGALNLGTTYKVQARARDTNNVWSVDWSPATTFWINAAPLTPSSLTPSDGVASSTRPKLVVTATDPNTEDPTSSLVVKARIKDAAGVVLQTRTMTYNSSTTKFEYQTDATDLPAFGTYKWDAYSYDGAHYSGGATAEASATKSAEATFVYADGPSVTLTGPTSPVNTVEPSASWSATYTGGATQKSYRIRLLNPTTGIVVYDTNHIMSTATSATILKDTYWLGGERWNNGETFALRVTITDTNDLFGSSADTPITLTYPPIDPVDFVVSPVALPGTSGVNAIALSIYKTGYSPDDFNSYRIVRHELVGDTDLIRPGSTVPLKTIEDPNAIEFLDADVTSGQVYRYDVSQALNSGNDVLVSPVVSHIASVRWDGTIVHVPAYPTKLVVALRYGAIGGEYDPTVTLGQPHRLDTPVGVGGRVAHFGPGTTMDPSGEYGLANDAQGTVEDRLRKLLEIYEAQRGGYDQRPHVLCWRDGRGGPLGRIYSIITGEPTVQHTMGGTLAVSIQFALVSHTLGEVT